MSMVFVRSSDYLACLGVEIIESGFGFGQRKPASSSANPTTLMSFPIIRSPLDFIKAKRNKESLSLLTCYDYSFAHILAETDISAVLIGDSLSNVVCGDSTTVKVTTRQIVYHALAVRKALPNHFIISDMPFLSSDLGQKHCLLSARSMIQEAGVNAVKIEGCHSLTIANIRRLIRAGIPVMGHLGLEPQKILLQGKYHRQGKDSKEQNALKAAAKRLEEAGCFAIVLELIPSQLAQEIDEMIDIPTIGIGAGPHTSGQILVLHDMLGFGPAEEKKSFVKRYAELRTEIRKAIQIYCQDVREKKFPK